MALRDLDRPATLTAALGPTNTGKTYRAIRRMIGHGSGILGLPLRLLAREVYDRVRGEVGHAKVALLTGEERILPPTARFFICTTESMPTRRDVAFVGIDEVQLATHPERGHIFTDRLLHARGLRETWFMGSDSMVPVVEALVPTATIERFDRLSRLSFTGECRLAALPPRSAVVAFSARDVYELAERIRARRGGAAVVMGALSPRARNAQVAMYQSGEVQYIVATDAIGMGLNMDINHVAFGATRKFDGRTLRDLTASELAQVAGRAGRHTRDGTFGTLEGIPPLDPMVVEDITQHRFAPVQRIEWRNHDLDTSSLVALQDSLERPPFHRMLRPSDPTHDTETLVRLARRPDIRAKADTAETVALLWEVCRVPDFRNTLLEAHVHLLAQVFLQLTSKRGVLAESWMAEAVERLDRIDGDIETLMARIAHIRTWTYISQRESWVPDALGWQERTRAVEDRLSDALHAELTRRFVDHRTAALVEARSLHGELTAHIDDSGGVEVAGHHLGALRGFEFQVAAGSSARDNAAATRAARGALGPIVAERLDRLCDAPDDAFTVNESGEVVWEEEPIARVVGSEDLLLPDISVLQLELVDSHGRKRIHEKVLGWVRRWVADFMAPLNRVDLVHLKPAARALRYTLEQNLGLVRKRNVAREVGRLSPLDRKNLARMDVRIGTQLVYVDTMLKPDAIVARAVLWCAHRRQRRIPPIPPEGSVSVPVEGSRAFLEAIGYVPTGPRALRADQLERLLLLLRRGTRTEPYEIPAAMPSWFACTRPELHAVIEALGFPRTEEGLVLPRPNQPRRRSRGRPRRRRR